MYVFSLLMINLFGVKNKKRKITGVSLKKERGSDHYFLAHDAD